MFKKRSDCDKTRAQMARFFAILDRRKVTAEVATRALRKFTMYGHIFLKGGAVGCRHCHKIYKAGAGPQKKHQ